jgi:hypothetical protein
VTGSRFVFAAGVLSTIALTAGPVIIVAGQKPDQLAERRERFSHDASAVDAELDASDGGGGATRQRRQQALKVRRTVSILRGQPWSRWISGT